MSETGTPQTHQAGQGVPAEPNSANSQQSAAQPPACADLADREGSPCLFAHALGVCGIILLCAGAGLAEATASDWPQWRGPTRTGHASADAPVPAALPKESKPLWKISVGPGFSSPVVAGDKLVYLDEQGGQEVAHVLEAGTGQELWRLAYAEALRDELGAGPRSTPIVDGDRLYAQSCKGEFRCLALADGKIIWQTSFEKDFGVRFLGGGGEGGTATRRGNNGSGVIDGDHIILPVGSTQGASLVCFDKRTGRVIWKSQNDEAAYSSLMMATLAGAPQVVALTAEALMGVGQLDGKLLWRVPLKTFAKRHAATPVILGDTVTVNSTTVGLVCTRISRKGDEIKASPAWVNKAMKINLSTPVAVGHYLYCQGPNRDYVCVDALTGELKWSQPGFGQGRKDNSSTIAIGSRLLVLAEDGQLVLIAADPEKYRELARLQVCGNTWCFPAYAAGRIFVRDSQHLICLDLMAVEAPAAKPTS